jgi:hypothetical protein
MHAQPFGLKQQGGSARVGNTQPMAVIVRFETMTDIFVRTLRYAFVVDIPKCSVDRHIHAEAYASIVLPGL